MTVAASTERIAIKRVADAYSRSFNAALKATQVVKRGYLLLRDPSTGFFEIATSTTGLVSGGVAAADIDSTGYSSGVLYTTVEEGIFEFYMGDGTTHAVALADIGKPVYALNNQSVTMVSTGRSICGIVAGLSNENALKCHVLVGAIAHSIGVGYGS